MGLLHLLPSADQAAIVRVAEVAAVRKATAASQAQVIRWEQIALPALLRNADLYGAEAAVSIARHTASATRARDLELFELDMTALEVTR